MKRTNTGMSLAELLIVVCLLCIASSIALPAFSHFLQRNTLEALADQLQGQLAHARALSVATHRDVELCGTVDGTTCTSSWERGWILRSPATGLVISHHAIDDPQQLRWAGASKKISFYPNGTTKMGNGRFYLCDRQGELAWQLVLNKQGRIKRIRGLERNQQASKPCG
ncbi:GspH/FimT family pseudopilin [Stutzerimonas azotifigens]|uniref:Type II secretion system protein H n=1 Tax=Stutzerimonas azotifigens TaxID=291995 RepID=A0ABR5YVA0_9GAMM|nr:GspH/FimT family pseudopilin [Stutzerimonas azotifigens]MBA1271858.1 hypothetical protein [Stutzerimonas azotifigens]